MAKNPKSVHQFSALRELERAFADDPGLCRSALDRLGDGLSIDRPTVAGIETGLMADGHPEPLAHLRSHWLSGGYWPNIDAATILAALESGFRAAAEDAAAENLPLVPIWVCATDDSEADTFRVDHVVTATTVVVTIITPKPIR